MLDGRLLMPAGNTTPSRHPAIAAPGRGFDGGGDGPRPPWITYTGQKTGPPGTNKILFTGHRKRTGSVEKRPSIDCHIVDSSPFLLLLLLQVYGYLQLLRDTISGGSPESTAAVVIHTCLPSPSVPRLNIETLLDVNSRPSTYQIMAVIIAAIISSVCYYHAPAI